MKKVFYRKLIRDKIPEKMNAKGVAYQTRTLSHADFKRELLKKVGEEASRLPTLKKRSEILEELADVLEVVAEIQRAFKISDADLREKRKAHLADKGGFLQRIFLDWSDDDYKTNEEIDSRSS